MHYASAQTAHAVSLLSPSKDFNARLYAREKDLIASQ